MRRNWNCHTLVISSAQSLSRIQLLATPWTAAWQASLSITSSRSLLKLTYIAGRNAKWRNDLENNLAASYKFKHKPTI